MKKTVNFYPVLFIAMMIFMPVAVFAGPPPLDTPIPVDGGASLLVGAAVAYGIKKYRKKKVEQTDLTNK